MRFKDMQNDAIYKDFIKRNSNLKMDKLHYMENIRNEFTENKTEIDIPDLLKSEIQGLKDKIMKNEITIEEQTVKLSNMEQMLESKRQKLECLELVLHDFREKENNVREEVEKGHIDSLECMKNIVQMKEQEKLLVEESCDLMKKEHLRATKLFLDNISIMERKILYLYHSHNVKELQLNEKDKEIAGIKNELKQARTCLAQSNSDNIELSKKNETISKVLKNKEEIIKNTCRKIKEIQSLKLYMDENIVAYEQLQSGMKQLTLVKEKLEDELIHIKKLNEEYSINKKKENQELDRIKNEYIQLKLNEDQQKLEIDKLRKEIKDLLITQEEINKKWNEECKINKTHEIKIEKIIDQLNRTSKENAKELEEKFSEIKKLNVEKEIFGSMNKQLKKECRVYQKTILALKKSNRQLKTKIRRRINKLKNETKNNIETMNKIKDSKSETVKNAEERKKNILESFENGTEDDVKEEVASNEQYEAKENGRLKCIEMNSVKINPKQVTKYTLKPNLFVKPLERDIVVANLSSDVSGNTILFLEAEHEEDITVDKRLDNNLNKTINTQTKWNELESKLEHDYKILKEKEAKILLKLSESIKDFERKETENFEHKIKIVPNEILKEVNEEVVQLKNNLRNVLEASTVFKSISQEGFLI